MQWMKALLMSGTPPVFWTDHHQNFLHHHHHHQISQPSSAQPPSQLHHDQLPQLQEQLPLQPQAPGTGVPSDQSCSCHPSPLGQQSGGSIDGQSLPIAESLPIASPFVSRQDLGLKSLLQDPSMPSSPQRHVMMDPPESASGQLPTGPDAEYSVPAAQYPGGHVARTHAAARQSAVQLSAQQQQQQQQQQQAPKVQRLGKDQPQGQYQPQGRPQHTYSQSPAQAAQSPADPSQSHERQHQSPGNMYEYLDQLPGELVACRRVLQYSFVMEYFWQASPDQARSVVGSHC